MNIKPLISLLLFSATVLSCVNDEKNGPEISFTAENDTIYNDDTVSFSGNATAGDAIINSFEIAIADNIIFEEVNLNTALYNFTCDTLLPIGDYQFRFSATDNAGLSATELKKCVVEKVIPPYLSILNDGLTNDTIIQINTPVDISLKIKEGIRTVDSIYVCRDSAENVIQTETLSIANDSILRKIRVQLTDTGHVSLIIIVSDVRGNRSSANVRVEAIE